MAAADALNRSKAQSLTQDTARAELRAGIEDVRFWPDAERGCAAWWAARVRFLLAERDTISETGKAIWAICQEYGIKHKPFCSMASSEEESTEACDCGLVEKVFTALKGN